MSVVYFIQSVNGGPIKIGHASNLLARLKHIQVSNPEQLCIVAVCAGGRALERELHAKFSDSHIRGEWFHPTPDILAEIDAHRLTTPDPLPRRPKPPVKPETPGPDPFLEEVRRDGDAWLRKVLPVFLRDAFKGAPNVADAIAVAAKCPASNVDKWLYEGAVPRLETLQHLAAAKPTLRALVALYLSAGGVAVQRGMPFSDAVAAIQSNPSIGTAFWSEAA